MNSCISERLFNAIMKGDYLLIVRNVISVRTCKEEVRINRLL